ncbi:pyridoxamine 5'-phosphate oxidase family protein [Actinocatenispora rupis]|uniref:Pyridoxamine 5'-phosphate oxidase N-terminal domain-containing protein n=1 Tax=Actinocatenispora rupis TaxID=519421 RepID=A0A8J3NDI3_9ACTN|nr:pyridoxamine 5'-phosphate oxidase family protein [Actinocatenispora rupis]GID11534.1 hypothetical protein Aru02nite_24230 [Actinocatenispora rupis]
MRSRTADERRRDVLDRLTRESDVWVATAGEDRQPWLVPLWFRWDGTAIWLSTSASSPTGRNLRETGAARLAFGDTDDVVIVDGDVETFTTADVPVDAADAIARAWGWDPRRNDTNAFFRVLPRTVLAWHGEHELPGRRIMTGGTWTTPS